LIISSIATPTIPWPATPTDGAGAGAGAGADADAGILATFPFFTPLLPLVGSFVF